MRGGRRIVTMGCMASQPGGKKASKGSSRRIQPRGDENASFEWTFEAGTYADEAGRTRSDGVPRTRNNGAARSSDASSPLAAKYRGADGARRVQTVVALLDTALQRWWQYGEFAPRDLVREGLLVLEAGHSLDEAQRTLLFRSALFYGVGQLTALRYQTDMERVALVLQEAALTWAPPLDVGTVSWLAEQDPRSVAWLPLLEAQLRTLALTGGGMQAQRAGRMIDALARGSVDGLSEETAAQRVGMPPTQRAGRARWVMAAVLLIALAGLVWWQVRVRRPGGMVEVPPGSYLVQDPGVSGAERRVSLDGFLIDRYEVTNRAYRRCAGQGACPWPDSVHSATRQNYFLNPAFADFPMVNIPWEAAAAYCRWAGKRLPTAEEWEVAAGYAPATNRHYRYPWGEEFEIQRANSEASGLGDTVAVNQYGRAGDSPLGVTGMAGNVAEWTSTQVQPDPPAYVVKGGSYHDPAEALAVTAQTVMPGEASAAWLGVRCARTLLLDQ